MPLTEMTRLERIKFWFLANRLVIGAAIGGISGIFRFVLTFQGHTDTADTLKGIADLVAGTGGALALSGATQPDKHYAEKKEAILRSRSGQYPVYRRRLEDRRGSPFQSVGHVAVPGLVGGSFVCREDGEPWPCRARRRAIQEGVAGTGDRG